MKKKADNVGKNGQMFRFDITRANPGGGGGGGGLLERGVGLLCGLLERGVGVLCDLLKRGVGVLCDLLERGQYDFLNTIKDDTRIPSETS